jgi:hypothetical protein
MDLDKYFNEIDEPNKKIFNKITTPEELHYIAENHNWDNGITLLEWIVESQLCSEATALMIFWRAQPYDYLKYNLNKKLPKDDYVDTDIFNLIKTIMEKYKNGFYKKTSIKYNPKEDMPENIPEIMFEETMGEEPYIYYDGKEVNSWFGEYMDTQIARCNSSIDLYNIAYLLNGYGLINNYEKIISSEYYDKGIALLLYWRLKKYSGLNHEETMERIKINECKEILNYNPKNDEENNGILRIQWEIPEIMKMEIK